MTMRPSRCPMLRACTTPSRFSTVSAKPARAAARTSARPPSARSVPSCCSRASRLPSLRALKKTRPSPSTSTCTSVAAARPMRRALIWPPCNRLGATSTTLPSGALMRPSARSPPASPSPRLSSSRPDAMSSSRMRSVLASRPPTSTWLSRPNTMPRGLTSHTVPLARKLPKICDGSLPSTRFTSTASRPGWLMTTCSLAPMEKRVQSMPARAVPCWMSSRPGPVCFTLAWPSTVLAPSGNPKASGAMPSSATARLTGRMPTPPRRAVCRTGAVRTNSFVDMERTSCVPRAAPEPIS